MSSHREAPEISKDPVADNTDVYVFRDPQNPNMVDLIANWIPFEQPYAGPNYYEFGEDVLYSIYVDNVGDGKPHITYDFRFSVDIRDPNTFLYNTGPITNINDPTWNRVQSYSVTRTDGDPNNGGSSKMLASGLLCPPCNVGLRSTPNYSTVADQAVHTLSSGETVFAGQRRDGFYVDVGAAFDLLTLRPFQNLQRFPTAGEVPHKGLRTPQPGVDTLKFVNVQSIALQVPMNMLTSDGSTPTSVSDSHAVIGVWASASRQKARVFSDTAVGSPPASPGDLTQDTGPFVQISRLANPLFNEVLIPMPVKDFWNHQKPQDDSQFLDSVLYPEVQALLVLLYPGVFPNLARITGPTPRSAAGGFQKRADLEAILLTGIPPGIIPGFQNYMGGTPADMLRLNMAIPPVAPGDSNFSVYGILGGDLGGFPNGRRVYDDTTTVELRALAGLTYALVNPSYTPDAAASLIYDLLPPNFTYRYHSSFPWLGLPHDGYQVPTPEQQAITPPTAG